MWSTVGQCGRTVEKDGRTVGKAGRTVEKDGVPPEMVEGWRSIAVAQKYTFFRITTAQNSHQPRPPEVDRIPSYAIIVDNI